MISLTITRHDSVNNFGVSPEKRKLSRLSDADDDDNVWQECRSEFSWRSSGWQRDVLDEKKLSESAVELFALEDNARVSAPSYNERLNDK